MNWMAKRPTVASPSPATSPKAAKPGPSASSLSSANLRVSNALKEFLWLLADIPRARVLDLGAVNQSSLNFFIEKGFRVSTEDMLREWKDFLTMEEEKIRAARVGEETERRSPSALAQKFLEEALGYPEHSVHGVLIWDLLDYFDPAVLSVIMERLYTILHPGGTVWALFHSRTADRFSRYRIVDNQTIEVLPSPTLAVHAHVFQNREILDLFTRFRSSKTFVGRDQVREALFVK